MMKLNNLKIGARLAGSYALLLILMTLLTGVGIWLLRDFGARAGATLNDTVSRVQIVNSWRASTELNGIRTVIMITSDNTDEQAKLAPQMKATSAHISTLQKQLVALLRDQTGIGLYAAANDKRGAYLKLRAQAFKAKAAGDNDNASAIARGAMTAAQKDYLDSIDALVQHEQALTAARAREVQAKGKLGQMVLGGLWLGAILAAAASTVVTTRSITRPLAHARDVAEAVARGHLSNRQEQYARDESGQLLATLDRMRRDLYEVVRSVRASSAAIACASTQIAHGNEDLSARTELQAGALQETASSMEQLTATVRQNAENARQANQLASAASDVALKGGAVVAQVVTRMESIHASAQKITDIISVIDGIAFQTNILALNAAVEAARAGEQGRGFAVVASEVRNLAQRSAGAAKEIKALIEASAHEVDAGSELASKAGATMEEVVASVGRVTAIMREIAQATSEQELGISQVNQAINQMDATTQQNAGLVEEATTASQAMREQAAHLERVVSVFQLAQEADRRERQHRAALPPG
jgi:methyl-accepting chemotaxis protein